METKRCKQCGEIQAIQHFRPYYGASGTYNICMGCEKINSRAKYLRRKGDKASAADKRELEKIEELYEYQRLSGLVPPRRTKVRQDALDVLIGKYKQSVDTVPSELQMWLTAELTEEPEHYLEDIYEPLKAKYRPLLCVDSNSLIPQYDEKYSTILGQILERFFKYEDDYYKNN